MSEITIFSFEKALKDKYIKKDEKIRIFKQCFKEGLDINYQNSITLFEAILLEDYEFVKYLVESGINIHAKQDYALISIIKGLNRSLVHISGNAKDREQMLNKHLDILRILCLLLENGISANTQNNLIISTISTFNLDPNIIVLLVSRGLNPFAHNNLLFYKACQTNNLALISYLITIGLEFDKLDAIYIDKLLITCGNFQVKLLLTSCGFVRS